MELSSQDLKSECALMKSLYYRNRNQHGSSHLFQMLRKAIKIINERYDWDLLLQLDQVWVTIRNVLQKSGRDCSERIFVLLDRLYSAFQISLLVLDCCGRCVVEATNYLEQKIFVSLSAFIFASVARIYKLVVDLSTNMREAYTLLKDHFKADARIKLLLPIPVPA